MNTNIEICIDDRHQTDGLVRICMAQLFNIICNIFFFNILREKYLFTHISVCQIQVNFLRIILFFEGIKKMFRL